MSSSPPFPELLLRPRSPPEQVALKESAVSRLFIAPLTFISFLISLALIDQRNSSLRSHYHTPSHELSPQSLHGRSKQLLHRCIWRPRDQPYAYVKSPDASKKERNDKENSGSGGVAGAGDLKGGDQEPWHWNTKQKKMLRMQVVDAFEIRKWVVVALVIVLAGVAGVAACALHWGVKGLRGLS